MLSRSMKDSHGLITFHKPLPPYLLLETTFSDVGEDLPSLSTSSSSSLSSLSSLPSLSSSSSSPSSLLSSLTSSSSPSPSSLSSLTLSSTSSSLTSSSSSSVVEFSCVSQNSITRPGAKKVHSAPPCSIEHLQDTFLVEKQEADAIAQPLLDDENGFIKDLDRFLERRDAQRARKHQLLHKRWTECVWWPVQRSIQQHFVRRRYEGLKTRHSDYIYGGKVTTAPLKDPLFVYSRSRTKEKRAVLRCLTGHTDGGRWVMSDEEKSRSQRSSRNLVYMTDADGRCFRPECWSSIRLSRRCSAKS